MAGKKTTAKTTVKEPAAKKTETVKETVTVKKVLKARRPLLYDGRVFKTGEEIPFRDEKVNAWIKDGSAAWV